VTDAAPPWLPRLATQLALAGGVALGVAHLLQSRDDAQDARLDAILSEIDLLRHERDRLAALNDALLDEAHAADREAELARWQLRYAEERLRRAEAEADAAAATRTPAPRRLVLPVGAPPPSLPVDAPPALSAADRAAALPLGPGGLPAPDAPVDSLALSATAAALPSVAAPVRAVPFDPSIPPVRRAPSQLARDQAHTRWQGIIDEAVHEECRGRFGELAQLRCDDAVRRSLFAYSTHAVDCILTGNAVPDYIPGLGLRDLPSHAVPLARGAVILCDGALLNQAG
jgi:hypothetical protein